MQNWSLDTHPVIIAFREVASEIIHKKDTYFNLFLPPPYALGDRKGMDYLFTASTSDPTEMVCYSSDKYKLKLVNDVISTTAGFSKKVQCQVLIASPCSIAGIQFTLYDIDNNFYAPAKIPELSEQILKSAHVASEAQRVLDQFDDAKLTECMRKIDGIFVDKDMQNLDPVKTLGVIHEVIDDVCRVVFGLPQVEVLSVGLKRAMNMLIFNAISAKAHFALLMAFNADCVNDNKMAQQASRFIQATVDIDKEKMEHAVRHLRGILHLSNPMEMIDRLVLFFDEIVAALPGVEVAADDILPAICLGMTRDPGFGSHVVSFFNYLTELWPSQGMDQRVTYILVTCSIASQHLTHVKEGDAVANKSPPKPVPSQENRDETIDALEDLLNFL